MPIGAPEKDKSGGRWENLEREQQPVIVRRTYRAAPPPGALKWFRGQASRRGLFWRKLGPRHVFLLVAWWELGCVFCKCVTSEALLPSGCFEFCYSRSTNMVCFTTSFAVVNYWIANPQVTKRMVLVHSNYSTLGRARGYLETCIKQIGCVHLLEILLWCSIRLKRTETSARNKTNRDRGDEPVARYIYDKFFL